ncbi:MAG TPA: BLUF domain-containing protein [Arenibaculum sp.]|nr:BLUF domain-containing protein [Arenibaculum sp.]
MAGSHLILSLYVSSARGLLDDAELAAIIERSRINNRRDGVTGMLLYCDGNFMQAIEGPEDSIEALERRLAVDPRHRNIISVVREPVPERQFGNWTMAAPQVSRLPVNDRSIVSDFFSAPPDTRPGLARLLIEGFRRSMAKGANS